MNRFNTNPDPINPTSVPMDTKTHPRRPITRTARIPARPRPNVIGVSVPLTDAQQEIWFAAQLSAAGSAAFHQSCTVELHTECEISLLRRAAQLLADRHEALRTTFSPKGDLQHIAAAGRVEAAVAEYSAANGDPRHSLQALADELVRKPFDLERGPLWRLQLARLSTHHCALVLVVHHIICDGWSQYRLIRELGDAYTALLRNEQPSFPPAGSFGAYARERAGELETPQYAEAESYWLERYSGAVPVTDLPSSRPRPTERTYAGAYLERAVDPNRADMVRRLAGRHNWPVFPVLFGGFAALMHRLTRQDDLVVGVPFATQVFCGEGDLIGNCANLLPIRSRLDPRQDCAAFLDRARRSALEAFHAWQYPFGRLVRKLNLSGDSSVRAPLANVVFNMLSLSEPVRFGDSHTIPAVNPNPCVNFDIYFTVTESGGAFTLGCHYSAELFDADFIERLMEQYLALLETMATDRERLITHLPVPTETERRQLLVDWNNTRADYPRDATVHSLIADQTARTPGSVAVQGGSTTMTYRELDEQSERLAESLRGAGVQPGVLVGLCVDRSPLMLVSMLGILKAGGAYVPLDPAYPKERLAYMLDDSHARVVVTQRDKLGFFPGNGPRFICIEDEWPPALHEAGSNGRPAGAHAGHPAYVLYTSGSTGLPKGVVTPHRALVNFLCSMQRTPGISEEDVLLAVTTLSFDIAALELFLPLTVGARVVIATREEASDAGRLSALLEAVEATVMQATPATWQMLLANDWRGSGALRVFCGGEAMPRNLADRLIPRCAELWNLYGPTETTIWSSAARVLPGTAPVVIGGPIANTQFHLLDSRMQLVPVGVPGELYIGGEGLAIGYLNRPDLTEERFIPDPFAPPSRERAPGPPPRIYRTGDLGRRLPGGEIELLGRLDDQVKVRGRRIETGEIEAALRTRKGVREAVVMAREDTPGDQRLVAYLIADNESPDWEDLRRGLQETLPEYMIPVACVPLANWPLTPNGKINRRALPRPGYAQNGRPGKCTPPRTATEEVVARIWSEVLGLGSIDVHQNFFDLGGHSLLATQALARVQDAFQIELPFRRLFENPTVARLASVVDEALIREIGDLTEDEAARRIEEHSTVHNLQT